MSQLFTVERRAVPLDYRGVNHARVTADMEELPGTPLKMLLRLRRLIGDRGRVRITGGVRGAAVYFGWAAPNGRLQEYLNLLEDRGYIEHTWSPASELTIEVLAPAGLGDPAGIEQPAAPAARPSAAGATFAGDPLRISINHDHDQQQQPAAQPSAAGSLSAQQQRLYAALRAHNARPAIALAIVERQPGRTAEELQQDIAAAARRRGVRCPAGLVFSCWLAGEPVVAPSEPSKEAEHAPHYSPGLSAAQPRRPAQPAGRGRPAGPARHAQSHLPSGLGVPAFLRPGADGAGGAELPAV